MEFKIFVLNNFNLILITAYFQMVASVYHTTQELRNIDHSQFTIHHSYST